MTRWRWAITTWSTKVISGVEFQAVHLALADQRVLAEALADPPEAAPALRRGQGASPPYRRDESFVIEPLAAARFYRRHAFRHFRAGQRGCFCRWRRRGGWWREPCGEGLARNAEVRVIPFFNIACFSWHYPTTGARQPNQMGNLLAIRIFLQLRKRDGPLATASLSTFLRKKP